RRARRRLPGRLPHEPHGRRRQADGPPWRRGGGAQAPDAASRAGLRRRRPTAQRRDGGVLLPRGEPGRAVAVRGAAGRPAHQRGAGGRAGAASRLPSPRRTPRDGGPGPRTLEPPGAALAARPRTARPALFRAAVRGVTCTRVTAPLVCLRLTV